MTKQRAVVLDVVRSAKCHYTAEEVFEKALRGVLNTMHGNKAFENLNIAKPYSFVLTDDDRQSIVDLLIVDDDTLILSEDLLKGFDEEMNEFLKQLLEE